MICAVEPTPMHVLTHLGEFLALREKPRANDIELFGVVCSHIKHLLGLRLGKGIDPDRKHRELAGATTGFMESTLISVKTRWRIGLHIAHALVVLGIRGQATG